MLNPADHTLLTFYLNAPEQSATATQVKDSLGYPSVGAVNLHVVSLAKRLKDFFGYKPEKKPNGQLRWWPCLFDGHDSAEGFVWTLRKDIQNWYLDVYAVELFYRKVCLSLQDSKMRANRLSQASTIQKKQLVKKWEFERNPDVVAETLSRANGYCQACGGKAPFNRKSDGRPYLEVHHRVPLSVGGEDSLENTIALCPNCHREAHYG